ncbi:hypothetical protein BO94DRAFT_520435 [Aspergillus sclerotioniger CBS 115572]|uniref:Serine hydrolase domain-containing protein n=1 Tax=Aspergillus sclerotioniger CBS 115572 TaxID=1450535 RepID=A0A317W6E5_9EURO|nr:hypothetical protein BO94DRAFT_520435 [Aspergillus sclerotioniger CBS 115572]PWY81669.1 hypothetical protein BO94DRAFT_520435 [Aspergillus sclerotioniger CBS 115572]
MPLKLLCLHGWGTNVKIFQSQLGGLMADLRRDNTATFHFVEGDVDSAPGPGIAGFYDGPYYSYYHFPLPLSDPESGNASLMDAYDWLYDVVNEDGPFDGILGFSHGGTLAAGFLIHHAKTYPREAPLFRCAIFINSLPPFRMDPGGDPVVDSDLGGYINIPTVTIAGVQDPLLEYSIALYQLCDPNKATWVVHSKGHDVPGDKKNVSSITTAIRKLAIQALAIW